MWPGARMKINTALPAFSPHHPPAPAALAFWLRKCSLQMGLCKQAPHISLSLRSATGATQQSLKLSFKSFFFFFFFTFFPPFSLFFNPSRGRSSFSPQYCLSPAINGALWQGIYWKQNSQALQWELCARQILHNLFARRQLAALPPRQPHSRLGLRPAETGP